MVKAGATDEPHHLGPELHKRGWTPKQTPDIAAVSNWAWEGTCSIGLTTFRAKEGCAGRDEALERKAMSYVGANAANQRSARCLLLQIRHLVLRSSSPL